MQNAETAALESLRLAPGSVNAMLDYLRIAQRTKTPSDFLAELELRLTASAQPRDRPVAGTRLAHRPQQRRRPARYLRFVELAPSHPLRPEADAAIARLRALG